MMDLETPINDVARMLSTEAAGWLMFENFEVQRSCLESVREHLVNLEGDGIVLDPIAMQLELDQIVRVELILLGRMAP